MYIKRNVRINNLETIELSMKGQETCANGIVKINGIEIASKENGHGILSFEISLPANGKPEVTVCYNPHRATKDVCEVLGIEKRPSYRQGNY